MHVYNEHDHIYPQFPTKLSPNTPNIGSFQACFSSFFLFFLDKSLNVLSAAHMCIRLGPAIGARGIYPWQYVNAMEVL